MEVTDPAKVSEIFNQYFVSIGEKLSNSFSTNNDTRPLLNSLPKSFYLKPISVNEVSNHIKNMDVSKSVRPGDPPIYFIKMANEVISPILTQIFNLCIRKGVYLSDMKIACVVPIYKKGEKNKCGNHRPISLISPFSKIFEKCILSQLDSFFSLHNLLTDKQFGFKKNISTGMALSNVYESFISNLEQNLITCSVFIDISKAFDSVNHKRLLNKLQCYGVRGLPLQLLSSYLSGRSQYTVTNGQKSSLLPISCGVPQGSVLGPFFFSVFINDLPDITDMQATLFADDACFCLGHNCITTMERLVNLELDKINKWFQNNRLALNIGKTKFMMIHRRREEIKLQLKINGTTLEQTDQIKYLGVVIDKKLNWKPHIINCTAKLGKCLWAITKLRPYTNIAILKLVYYSLAYPYLQYCISSWGGASTTSLQPLFVKQKLIIKSMLHQNYMSHSSPLFLKLDILKLPEIYELQIGRLMKKQIIKNTSQNILPLSTVHSYNTRSTSKKKLLYSIRKI